MAKNAKKLNQEPSLEVYQTEIRKRAAEIYKERTASKKPGDGLSDWLQAEKEVQKKYKL